MRLILKDGTIVEVLKMPKAGEPVLAENYLLDGKQPEPGTKVPEELLKRLREVVSE